MHLSLLLNRSLCDYRCIFCTMGSARFISQSQELLAGFDYGAEWERIEQVLQNGLRDPRIDQLNIMGNDPGNYPSIAGLIRLARNLGYQRIVLETIGLKLDEPSFAEQVVDAGVTSFKIPIYGSSAGIHDTIVRLPGAFDRLMRVLDRLSQLRVEVQLHTLILRLNLHDLPRLLSQYLVRLRYPFCHERADLPYPYYAPRLSDLSFPLLLHSDVRIPCINGRRATPTPQAVRVRPEAPDQQDDDPNLKKIRPSKCTPESCHDFARCEGIYRHYYDAYGEDEFQQRVSRTAAPWTPGAADLSDRRWAQDLFDQRLHLAVELNPPTLGADVIRGCEDRGRFVVDRLGRPEGLCPAEFAERFGEPLERQFETELRCARILALLEERDGSLFHTAANPHTRLATELLFVDEEVIETAARSTAAVPAAESQRLAMVFRTRGREVSVVLTEYWPQRPCYHHAGPWAFYIPSGGPEDVSPTAQEHAELLVELTRLFDQVIAQEAPADLPELKKLLLLRGAPGFSAPG